MNLHRLSVVIRTVFLFLAALALLAMPGCAARKAPSPAPAFVERSYIDLAAGWRIRVVAPVVKSGGFKVKTEEVKSTGGEVQLKTTSDFLGYQVDYYSIAAREGGGVRVRFKSAEMRDANGKRSRQSRPRVHLFETPEDARYFRLLFLKRLSTAEHDAVILAAPSLRVLNDLTVSVEANPTKGCELQLPGSCSWIPQGISVQPERKANGTREWVPAL